MNPTYQRQNPVVIEEFSQLSLAFLGVIQHCGQGNL